MKPKTQIESKDDMRPEYEFDFSKATRGRYAARLKKEGSNLVLVDPELAKSFPDSTSVNAALRSVIEFAKLSAGLRGVPLDVPQRGVLHNRMDDNNMNSPEKLPNKLKITVILVFCLIGYGCIEYCGFFENFKDWDEAKARMFNRVGIVITYLGALIAGYTFVWDRVANKKAASAEQRKALAESENYILGGLNPQNLRAWKKRFNENSETISSASDELKEVSDYKADKNWLGKVALISIVLGAWLQLAGASHSPQTSSASPQIFSQTANSPVR